MNETQSSADTCHVAIVGFGPKGLYALAGLVAEMWRRPWAGGLELHLFEKGGHFGAGQVYRPDQPLYLRMNIPTVDVSRSLEEAFESLPEVMRSMDEVLDTYGDYEFMPRAEVGKVLMQAYAAIQTALPPGVAVREWHGEVTDIVRDGSCGKIAFNNDAGTQVLPYSFQHILLSTGHPGRRHIEDALLPFCPKAEGLPYYEPSVYPVRDLAASAKTDATVIIRGMGLTFVDAVLALTEGRGGKFTESASQRYRYVPSDREPKSIVPFSRSGLLMPARDARQMRYPHGLRFFTSDFAERLLKEKGGNIDFETDLWPIIEAEYLVAFYGCLMPTHGFDLELSSLGSPDELRCRIAAFHKWHSSIAAFEPRTYLKSMGASMVAEIDDYQQFSIDAIAAGIDAAVAGPKHSPLAAVANVWRAISPEFNKLYSCGGLSAASQKAFDAVMNGQLQCLTYGPCAENMKKLLALAEAGIVDFGCAKGATLHVDAERRSLRLESRDRKMVVEGDVLIEARIPRLSLESSMPPLYASLLASGQIRSFENTSAESSYRPGCPDMDADGRAIDRDGGLHPLLTFAGTPTEGYFYDNDTLSPLRNDTSGAWAKRIRERMPQKQEHAYEHRH